MDGEEINCKGKEPGYHADIESDCRKYLLCTSSSANTRGLHFNCPPGEEFSKDLARKLYQGTPKKIAGDEGF